MVYETPKRWSAATIPFLKSGLERGEKCIYVEDSHSPRPVCARLQEQGVDAMAAQASGQLVIVNETHTYTREGFFDPDTAVATLIARTEQALSEGYTALRVAAEMTWANRGCSDSEKLLEYESKVNEELFRKYPCVALCQYDRWRFAPEIIKGVIMTHPFLVHGDNIFRNCFYVPPEHFTSHERAEREVQNCLNSLEREHVNQKRVELLANVIERSSQPFSASYPGGMIMAANRAFCELTGYNLQELRTMTWLDMTPLEWREQDDKMLEQVRRTGRPRRYEKELVRRDGSRVPVEVLADQVVDSRGKVRYWYSFITDITDRKRAETELLANRERLKHLLCYSPAVIYSWKTSDDYRATFVSENLTSKFGYAPQEFLQDPNFWANHIHPDDVQRVIAGLSRLYQQGYHSDEYRLLDNDGIYRWVHDEMRLVRDEAGMPSEIIGCWLDVTERKVAEEGLRESLRALSTLMNNPLA